MAGITKLRVDPDFKAACPALAPEEEKDLRNMILEEGQITDPIHIWRGPNGTDKVPTIADGHNRWAIYQKAKGKIEAPEFIELEDLTSKGAVLEWIYRRQLARRNLDRQRMEVLRGKLAASATPRKPGPAKNGAPKKSVAEEIAGQTKTSRSTVLRDKKYVEAIDRIRAADPVLANRIESGTLKVSKKAVIQAGTQPTNAQCAAAVTEAAKFAADKKSEVPPTSVIRREIERQMGALARSVDKFAKSVGQDMEKGRHAVVMEHIREAWRLVDEWDKEAS